MKGAATARLITSGILRPRLNPRLVLPLAILAGLMALGSTMCGGDPRFELESLRWLGTPRWVLQWTPDGDHIIFDGNERGKSGDIYIVRSDGSELKRISASSGGYAIDSWPDISPDGTRVVYTTSRHRTMRKRNFEIETSKLDGSDRRRLTENLVHDVSPAWSPDGSRIAFKNYKDGNEIVVMAADGSDKRNLSDSWTLHPGDFDLEEGSDVIVGGLSAGPVWSPDGEMISFVGDAHFRSYPQGKNVDRDTLRVLYTVGADGEGLTPLFVAGSLEDVIARAFSWSPDGRELVFAHYNRATEEWVFYAIGRDGSGLRKLAEAHSRSRETSEYSVSNLYWTPGGDEIRFGLSGNVYFVKADGSGYGIGVPVGIGSWSPDGSRIAVRGLSGTYLSTIAPDGSDERALVRRYTDGSLRAANPGNKKCLLWFCW